MYDSKQCGDPANRASSRISERTNWKAVLSIFSGGLAHALLPSGAFGAHDIAIRAVITGVVAGLAYLAALTVSKQWMRPN